MTPDFPLSSPNAARLLGVSPSTLRRWSRTFATHLSPPEPNQSSKRGYTPDDIRTLEQIKSLLDQGLNSDEVASRLGGDGSSGTNMALATTESSSVPITALSDGLQTIASGQKTILDSQQVNRDLLGVVIQDNFNLKEENARLRERMLRLEQELGDSRQLVGKQDALEERIEALEQSKVDADERGWLARFFGF